MPQQFICITLDAFVVMPNHFHGIVVIQSKTLDEEGRDKSRPYERKGENKAEEVSIIVDNPYVGVRFIASGTTSLGKIIRAFKAKSTFLINQHQETPGQKLWQRGYYDHIVRNEADLHRIRDYIANNPLQWALDENHPPK